MLPTRVGFAEQGRDLCCPEAPSEDKTMWSCLEDTSVALVMCYLLIIFFYVSQCLCLLKISSVTKASTVSGYSTPEVTKLFETPSKKNPMKAVGEMSSFPCLLGGKNCTCEMQEEQSCFSSHCGSTVLKSPFVSTVHSGFFSDSGRK